MRCEDTGNGGTPLDIDLDLENLSFTFDGVTGGMSVTCVVYNVDLDDSAQLRVNHTWRVDIAGDGEFEQVTGLNQLPTIIDGVSNGLTMDDANRSSGSNHAGFTVGDEPSLTQTINGLPRLCTVETEYVPVNPDDPAVINDTGDGSADYRITLASIEGVNEVTIVNTVVCQSRLTLTKTLDGGPGDPRTGPCAATPARKTPRTARP